jgi:tetratricopeptide (TPR) repeat protein
MRRALIVLTGVALMLSPILAGAQSAGTAATGKTSAGSFSLGVVPGISFPLSFPTLPASTYHSIAPSVAVDAEYRFGSLPLLYLKGGIGYRMTPLTAGPFLSLIEATAGAGAWVQIIPAISLKAYLAGGYHFGILTTGAATETGGAWAARAGVDVLLSFFQPIGIIVGAAGVVDGGAFLGVQASVGASYSFGASGASKPPTAKRVKPAMAKPIAEPGTKPEEQPGGLTLRPSFDIVFPVFHAWYDTNPLGRLALANGGKDPLTNIRVSFIMKQFMDGAWSSDTIARLEPGEDVLVPLNALFTQNILDINTTTKSLAEITVDYQVGADKKQAKLSESVRLQGRNGMTWADDDSRAAAFVTQTDPAVLTFARNVISTVKGAGSSTINENLSKAMAIHEAMRVFQMTYIPDPKTPYKDLVQRREAVDFLQFPRETLAYKAGDCDDLSILYCALLESLAVETAFITIPGHIYVAFSAARPPDIARSEFRHADELIFAGDKTWIPIEVTSLGEKGDFLEAWQLGAKEWRENAARSQARLYPLHAAWEKYEPVSLPKDNAPPPVPPAAAALVDRFQRVTIKFLDREMADELAKLTKQVADSQEDPKSLNSLGVLYAKYGRYAEAKVQFKKASVKSKTYLSPLLNLGMVAIVEHELGSALDFYEAARRIDPKNTRVLLGYARVNHEMENYGSVRTAYDELKKADPAIAAQFAYLDLRGDEAARAADIGKAKEVTLWAEQ